MPLQHADHVSLLRDGVAPGGTWAELGSGRGAFTLALADLLGPHGKMWSVDRDPGALEDQRQSLQARFPDVDVDYVRGDFTHPLQLLSLDGVLMANSLHFVRDKRPVLELARSYLRPGGAFLLVEYDADRGNWWVPHPLSFQSWRRLADTSGFEGTRLLATVPSGVLGRIYSAFSRRSTASASS